MSKAVADLIHSSGYCGSVIVAISVAIYMDHINTGSFFPSRRVFTLY